MITRDELCERVTDIENKIEQVAAEAKQAESRDRAVWNSETGGINLNRRGQILRLHRRGESVSEIATALKVSYGEVKLVLKVQQLSAVAPAKNSENSLKVSSISTDKTWETRIGAIRQ